MNAQGFDRMARFVVPHEMIEVFPDTVRDVLDGVLIVRAESRLDMGGVEYFGQHDDFPLRYHGFCAKRLYPAFEFETVGFDGEADPVHVPVFRGWKASIGGDAHAA